MPMCRVQARIMMGKTHVGFGVLFCAAGLPIVGNELLGLDFTAGQMVAGCAIGAIAGVLPDIDHPDSLITQGVIPGTKKLGMLAKVLGRILSVPPQVIGMFARQIGSHRGPTHSLSFAVLWTVFVAPLYALFFALAGMLFASLAGAVFQFFPIVGDRAAEIGLATSWVVSGVWSQIYVISAAVCFGYLSHLFSDGLTNAPNMYLWPISQKRYFLNPLKFLRITTDSFTEKILVRPLVYGLAFLCMGYFIIVPAGSDFTSKHFPDQSAKIQQQIKEKAQGTKAP